MTAGYKAIREELLREVYEICKDHDLSLEDVRQRILAKGTIPGAISLEEVDRVYMQLYHAGLINRR